MIGAAPPRAQRAEGADGHLRRAGEAAGERHATEDAERPLQRTNRGADAYEEPEDSPAPQHRAGRRVGVGAAVAAAPPPSTPRGPWSTPGRLRGESPPAAPRPWSRGWRHAAALLIRMEPGACGEPLGRVPWRPRRSARRPRRPPQRPPRGAPPRPPVGESPPAAPRPWSRGWRHAAALLIRMEPGACGEPLGRAPWRPRRSARQPRRCTVSTAPVSDPYCTASVGTWSVGHPQTPMAVECGAPGALGGWARHGSRLLPTLTKVIRCQSLLCEPPSAHRPIAPAESRVMTRPRGLLEGG